MVKFGDVQEFFEASLAKPGQEERICGVEHPWSGDRDRVLSGDLRICGV